MHRAPNAKAGGNAQKRIRICLDKRVLPEQLQAEQVNAQLPDDTADHAPGLTTTEKAYIRNARLGQGQFRIDLLNAFGETCPVLGITNPELLVASHIKPWSACTNQDRLDPENGILLSALIDRLFDRGLITFDSDGTIRTSPRLSPDDQARCRVDQPIHPTSNRQSSILRISSRVSVQTRLTDVANVGPKLFWPKCSFPVSLTLEPDRGYNRL